MSNRQSKKTGGCQDFEASVFLLQPFDVRLHAGKDSLRTGFTQPPFAAGSDAGLLRKFIEFSKVSGEGLRCR